jgi:ketosteroid isomerase-like protein
MAQAWLHADWVKCLHPGWDLLVGWMEVRGSWEEIFRSTGQMMISISRPLLHVAGDVAWISCLENVTTAYQNDFSSVMVETTNIFQRHQGRWMMVHHHTTPLAEPPPEASAPVQ